MSFNDGSSPTAPGGNCNCSGVSSNMAVAVVVTTGATCEDIDEAIEFCNVVVLPLLGGPFALLK